VDGTITVNGNTSHATVHHNPQGVIGTGETTGATYRGVGVSLLVLNGSLINGAFNATSQDVFDFLGQGQTENFKIHETLHVTLNADGTLTASVDNFSATCH